MPELDTLDALTRPGISATPILVARCCLATLTANSPLPIAHGKGQYRIMTTSGNPLFFMTWPKANHLSFDFFRIQPTKNA